VTPWLTHTHTRTHTQTYSFPFAILLAQPAEQKTPILNAKLPVEEGTVDGAAVSASVATNSRNISLCSEK